MPDLYWEIQWRYGSQPLDTETKKACQLAIQAHLLRTSKEFGPEDLGCKIGGLQVRIQNTYEEFSAQLSQIIPPGRVRVDKLTNIYAVEPAGTGRGGAGQVDSAMDEEIESFILWKATFDPARLDPYYMGVYEGLVGTEKEMILEEMASLLAPSEMLRDWSMKHYHLVLPVLQTVASKAPVIIFGGDPGTGKTALATSIGTPLAKLLRERVQFRHMSLSMRGMGFQGRASTLIARFFESINREYIRSREPMIIFFDEAEAIVGSRADADTDSGTQENVAIVDAIINGVDALRKGVHTRVVVVFATNIIGRIDSALMRRCYYYSFARPNEQVRQALFASSLRGLGFDDTAISLLVRETEPRMINGTEIPFTHSDIVELVIVRAVNKAIRMNRQVTLDLLLDCCRQVTPTKSLTK